MVIHASGTLINQSAHIVALPNIVQSMYEAKSRNAVNGTNRVVAVIRGESTSGRYSAQDGDRHYEDVEFHCRKRQYYQGL